MRVWLLCRCPPWLGWQGLNLRPPSYQDGALTDCATSQGVRPSEASTVAMTEREWASWDSNPEPAD